MREVGIRNYDVIVVGGGICGVSVAAYLAEDGLSVGLFEGTAIGAAASGRNSGAIQQPFDAALSGLHRETLAIYRDLAQQPGDFSLADSPRGLLIISPDREATAEATNAIAEHSPDLGPRMISAPELHGLEPMLAPGLVACRLETGWPVAPAAATTAMAQRARRAGAEMLVGSSVQSVRLEGGRAVGVRLIDGTAFGAGRIVVTAGPWTCDVVPGWGGSGRIRSVWGVVVSVRLAKPVGHVVEELGIDRPGRPPDELFSLVTAGLDSSVGSTFLSDRPEPASRVAGLMSRAAEFVPALADARPVAVRACARPLAFDGRPFIGAVPDVADLFVCAGHGPWGISTGPGSARRLVEIMAGRAVEEAAFTPARVVTT